MNKYKILAIYLAIILFTIAVVDSGITVHFRQWLRIQIPNLDKLGHFLGMGILVFLLLNAFAKEKPKTRIILIILFTISLATMEEFSQKLLQYRSFQLWDLAANYLGILSFSIAFLLIKLSKNLKLLESLIINNKPTTP
ncbi:MAG: hypothetical protein DRI84_04145 [Bacteroidetes bacterium]|nr:MAG: hypothetical protein DRI84_04145 [Bacteroidota bacterium]